eukprot:5066300-Prymnesium_polylepis.1
MPAFLFDELAVGGGALALRSRDHHRTAIQLLWQRVRLPRGHTAKSELPARCDVPWFSLTLCGGADLSALGPEDYGGRHRALPHLGEHRIHARGHTVTSRITDRVTSRAPFAPTLTATS